MHTFPQGYLGLHPCTRKTRSRAAVACTQLQRSLLSILVVFVSRQSCRIDTSPAAWMVENYIRRTCLQVMRCYKWSM
jgi:hypothetical protein